MATAPLHDEPLAAAYDARLLRRLLRYLVPHKASVAVALAAIVGHALLRLAEPYLVKLAIDRHILTGELAGLELIAAAMLVILTGSFLLEYLETYSMGMIGQRIMYDLRMEIYGHLQRIDVAYYDRHPVGRLMTRVTTDVDALNDLFASGVISVFRDVVMLVGIMAVLLWMDWRLALVAFAVLPFIALVTQWFRRNARAAYRAVRGWIAKINAALQENITGMSTVQLFRREARSYADFDRLNRGHAQANLDSIFYYATFYPAVELIGAVATAAIIWYGGAWTLEGTLTLGSLVAFIQYSQRFFRPISDLSEKFNILQAAMASSERIFSLLDTPPSLVSPAVAPSPPGRGEGRITFEHVWFAYRGDDYVLRDVSFTVEPGERIGIAGHTGAGKTTLINLLLRFYDVNRGRIAIDGVDIREIPLDALRRRFGLVLQDVFLFSGTIRDNIAFGPAAGSDAAVRAAADAAHASLFIDRLPGGLDAEVAERGATLSAGQKQLLSFARALAFDPQVLVLDEATSNVDIATETLIRDALHRLIAGRTTLAIAHRLSTVRDMDRILVFHKGELRESGPHRDLLAQRGLYHTLYELQYRDQEAKSAKASASLRLADSPQRG